MKTIEFDKFRKNWNKKLETIFWDKLRDKEPDLFLIYMFDFCNLNSDIKFDEMDQLYLCYDYEKTKESERNELLQSIFFEIFQGDQNDKYIGYYKSKRNDNFREVLMALFILGNDIDDIDLKNYLLKGNIENLLNSFQETGLDSELLLENYVNEISNEFKIIAYQTKDALFKDENLLKNSQKFLELISPE